MSTMSSISSVSSDRMAAYAPDLVDPAADTQPGFDEGRLETALALAFAAAAVIVVSFIAVLSSIM